MAKIKVQKTKNFTVMSNYHLRDRRLGAKAIGIMSFMLALPDHWDFSVNGLAKCLGEGRDSITSGLKKLEKYGYLVRVQKTGKGNRFAGYEYILYEKPNAEFPFTENPLTENPLTENPTQINIKEISTKKISTKEINNICAKPPDKNIKGGMEKSSPHNIKALTDEFGTIWDIYPNKKGKARAFEAYKRARKSGTTFEEIKKGVENYRREIRAKRTEPQFIKHGSTWFVNNGWLDDYDINDGAGYNIDEYEEKMDTFGGTPRGKKLGTWI